MLGQKGALQSVLNDLFEELIVANKPGVAPALQGRKKKKKKKNFLSIKLAVTIQRNVFLAALFENKDASVNLDPLGAVFRICSIPDRFYFVRSLYIYGKTDRLLVPLCLLSRSNYF